MWEKKILSIRDFEKSMYELMDMIERDKYKTVCGIPRGGYIPAVFISHDIEIPMIEWDKLKTIIAESNVDRLKKLCNEILIVDDIIDTGKTLEKYIDIGFDVATVFYKPRSSRKPKYYVHSTNSWIIFPWERIGEEPNRGCNS